jgi:hypothetical protein
MSDAPRQETLLLMQKLRALSDQAEYLHLLGPRSREILDGMPEWIDDQGHPGSWLSEEDRKLALLVVAPPFQADVIPEEIEKITDGLFARLFSKKPTY